MSTFLIADDHPLFREALQAALLPFFNDMEVIEADNLHNTISAIKKHPDIDVILLDLTMPGADHYYGLTAVLDKCANIPVVVITATDNEESVNVAMHLGAKGFVPKSYSSRKMAHAIMNVLNGGTFIPDKYIDAISSIHPQMLTSIELVKELTPKQLIVIKCLKQGKMNKEIADELCVTEATIKAHISAIFKKLNVTSRTQVVLLFEKLDTVN